MEYLLGDILIDGGKDTGTPTAVPSWKENQNQNSLQHTYARNFLCSNIILILDRTSLTIDYFFGIM